MCIIVMINDKNVYYYFIINKYYIRMNCRQPVQLIMILCCDKPYKLPQEVDTVYTV